MHLTFKDQVLDQRRIEQYFNRGTTPLTLFGRHQALRNKRAHIQRQIHQQLLFALFRKEIDDTVKRLVGTVGMQCPHGEVAGLGERNRMLHGFPMADFSDQNNVRGLAQRVVQGALPRIGVDADFALRNHTILVLVDKLDRIFDGDDVSIAVFIAITDHRR